MLWKIYFWLYLVTLLLFYLFSNFPWKPVDILFAVCETVGLIAAYGYLYKKKLLNHQIWRTLVSFAIGYWLFYILILDKQYGGYPPVELFDYLTGLLFPLPIFFLSARYALNPPTSSPKSNKKEFFGLKYDYWGGAFGPLIVLAVLALYIIIELLK